MRTETTFEDLITSIRQVHEHLASKVGKAVNIGLSLRNWIIGYYIREYEQNGLDRAEYGKNLLNKLSKELKQSGTVEYHSRELRRCRTFYSTYPQIWGTLSPEFRCYLPKYKNR